MQKAFHLWLPLAWTTNEENGMNTSKILILLSLFLSVTTYADVFITLQAKLVQPACVITTEGGDKELFINFRDVAVERLSEEKQTFGIVIQQCDLRKNLQIYLSPKEGGTLNINNETVLSTSIEGLGIRFSQENQSNALNLHQWERITPMINGGTGLVTLQSQLVTNKAIEDLASGPFRAALSIMIDYI